MIEKVDVNLLTAFSEFLRASGPYGLVVVLAWAFWRVNSIKDKELKELHLACLRMAEGQTAAIVKVETALIALKDAIYDMKRN